MAEPTSKLRTLAEAGETSARLKAAGKRIVFTNGCFDLLHTEHVSLLRQARDLGDCLIVGLNSDRSIRRLKGATRPINRERDRAEVLSAIQYIDHIVLFDEDTPCRLLRALEPHILVKGGDYTPETVIGRDIVLAYGGQVRVLDTDRGVSTTRIIERILDTHWQTDDNPDHP